MKKEDMSCIDCAVKNCNKMDKTYPDFCLTTHMDEEVLNEAMECYNEDENRKVTIAAAEVEYENYCKHTRVEEIMDFAKKINAKKIGIATCVGLLKESRILADILRRHGFEVYGVGCKAGTQKKTSVGIPECCEGVGVNMCNPILQAKLLNKAKTDLNVVVGLCVGHDSLFYKYSEALTTTAVTKDRVLGHNPVAALYTADSYEKLQVEQYVTDLHDYWKDNRTVFKLDSVSFLYIWGSMLTWTMITALCLIIGALSYSKLPTEIPVQWSKGVATSLVNKNWIFICPVICIIIRYLLKPFIYAKLQMNNYYGEIITEYLTNYMCFIVLSVEIFSILFTFGVVKSVVVLLFVDTAIFIGLLVVGLVKMDLRGKEIL